MISTANMRRDGGADGTPARCNEEASHNEFANNFGAASCIDQASRDPDAEILKEATTTIEQKDNDAIGDGNKDPCDKIFWFYKDASMTEKALILAVVFTCLGACCIYFGIWAFNRHKANQVKDKKFVANKDDWKKGHETGGDKQVV